MKPEEKDVELTESEQTEATPPPGEAAANEFEASASKEAGLNEATPTLAGLQAQLEEKEAEVNDYVDRLKRVQADFQNYKKRKEKEQAEVYTMIEDRLLNEFLPLYDDFSRAFSNFKNDEDQDAFIEGMERIFAKFKDHLDNKEVQQVEAVGKKFDPALHEVLLAVESAGDPNVVIEEFECGYTRKGRLLRPSRVTVSKQPAPPAPEPQADEANQPDPDQQDDHSEKES